LFLLCLVNNIIERIYNITIIYISFIMFQEDIKSLCSHVVENFSKELETIDYVQTFKALKLRYEQHQDKLKDRDRATIDRYILIYFLYL